MRFNEKEVRNCYKFLDHNKETEIRLICPKRINPPLSFFVHSEDEFVEKCKNYNEKYNIYAGINERSANGTEKKDVISVKTIVLDIDAIRKRGFEKQAATFEELKECEKDCDAIIKSIKIGGLKDPTKLYSGNGYQIWLSLPEIIIDDNNRKTVEEKLQMFQDIVKEAFQSHGSIDKIGDLPRIIKVWGTWNIKGDGKDDRPHKLCYISEGGKRTDNKILKEQVMNLEVKKDVEKIIIVPIDKLEEEFLPKPISFLLYEYSHIDQNNWMKIIETLSSFMRGIGLEEEKALSHIIDWCKRQPYQEDGEEYEVNDIVKRIYRNKIMCPNFDKLVDEETGYPYFGLKDVFDGIDLGDDWRKFKNPIKYYQVKKERNDMSDIDQIKLDVMTSILSRQEDTATETITQRILDTNFIYTTRDDIKSEIWFYDDGIYIPNGKSRIQEITRSILGEAYTPQRVNKVIVKVEADTKIDHDKFFINESIDEIPVQNGILNIFNKTISTFTPTKIFFNKLPINYDEDAKCPSIKKFFSTTLKDESDMEVMIELIGFCLLKEYRFEKSIMFIGDGRNGKGKTLSLMKYFLGPENCCSIPLSQINASSTSVCELHGRLANLAGDLSNTDLRDTGMFKQITGRDLITAKRKYLNDLFFTNYAKIIFACNELPKVYDLSDGFWSRWMIFEFPYTFVKKSEYDMLQNKTNHKIMDESIIEKITTKEELSGLLNEALLGLSRIIANKGFSYSKGTEEIKDLWVRKSDSFTAFCLDHIDDEYEARVKKKDIRKMFGQYCKKHKIPSASDKAIKVTLESRFGAYEVYDNLDQDRYWEGIKFR